MLYLKLKDTGIQPSRQTQRYLRIFLKASQTLWYKFSFEADY